MFNRIIRAISNLLHINRLSSELGYLNNIIKDLNYKLDSNDARFTALENRYRQIFDSLDPFQANSRRELLNRVLPKIFDVKLSRYGRPGDGGYYLADPLYGDDVLISAGLADDTSFEESVSKSLKKIVGLDHTIEQMANSEIFEHRRIGLKGESSEGFITLERLVSEYKATDYILKIDIEGDEWEVLDKTQSDVLRKFRQVVIEFHGFTQHLDFEKCSQMMRVVEKLLESHMVIFAHANNWGDFIYFGNYEVPDVVEVTYLRRDQEYESIDPSNSTLVIEENTNKVRPVGNAWINTILS